MTKFKYELNDNFWDLESFDNVFSGAHYYPATRKLLIYYIADDIDLSNVMARYRLTKALTEFFKRKMEIDPKKVEYWDLSNAKHAMDLVELFGVTSNDNFYNKESIDPDITSGLNDRPDNYIQSLNRYGKLANKKDLWYYPTKETDNDYDPKIHGRFFGYNSTNYDETMMAMIIYDIVWEYHQRTRSLSDEELKTKVWWDRPLIQSAQYIRKQYNDKLFEDFKNNMPELLQCTFDNQGYPGKRNFRSDQNAIRRAWRLTNRFIDVSRLNEKLSKVALKRIMSYLGLTIKEADTSNNTRVKDLDELIDRLIYNTSDVVNLMYVFENSAYLVPYNLHSQLLARYPQTIYKDNGDGITPEISPGSLRINRLTLDSTSAKFVEFIVAPYNALTDNETVDFMYPSKTAIKRIKREKGIDIKPFDVLEDTDKWFKEHVTNDTSTDAYKAWEQVYLFYSEIRGKNFNKGKKYLEDYPNTAHNPEISVDNEYIKRLMQKYNTNMFYYNKDLTPSSCYATLSIGGIHGAEIHKDLYDYDIAEMQEYNSIVDEIAAMTKNGTVQEALNNLKPKVTLANGEEVKVRTYIKNPKKTPNEKDMKKEHPWGEWKYKSTPELFSLVKTGGADSGHYKWELKKRYKYVSTGMANHEDFASYYPLLLSMLSAFENIARGYDENGEPIDVYYQLFQTRLIEKERSKDMSLSDEERGLADLTQLLMKLLINAASGVGDGSFDTNLRVNNKTIAMRIIGQLFALRIGMAQTLAGAKVPSTNTDGLYTMNISPEENNRILFETVADMHVDIEPEVLTNFVSKDSNNRIEIHINKKTQKEEIAAANGGSLTAWRGPEPTNNLAHPAMTDRILAEYLWKKHDAANNKFDREFARKLYNNFIKERIDSEEGRFELTRFLQWIMSSSSNSHRYVYQKEILEDGTVNLIQLQHYNRGFLIRKDFINKVRAYENKPLLQELQTNVAASDARKPKDDTSDATKIHKWNGYIAHKENKYSKTMKVSGLPETATVLIDNETQIDKCLPNRYNYLGADFFYDVIDHEMYLDLIQTTFENSWYNPQYIDYAKIKSMQP